MVEKTFEGVSITHLDEALSAKSPVAMAPIIVALLAVALLFSTPYFGTDLVALAPGPTRDAEKLMTIDATTYSSQGRFYITTALVSPGGISMAEAIKGWLDPLVSIYPKEAIYPPDRSEKQASLVQARQMSDSQRDAAFAALRELGIPLDVDGLNIEQVGSKIPASKSLKPGDVLLEADGMVLARVGDLTERVQDRSVGDSIHLRFRRGDQVREEDVRTIASNTKGREGKPAIGITVTLNARLPFKVEIDAQGIGGPSAGLVFAIGVYDLLTSQDLTGGRIIAGTGTIDPEGQVGAVGAITQKIAGAERRHAQVFLVPRDEYKEAKAALHSNMKLIPVSTLGEAIQALRNLR